MQSSNTDVAADPRVLSRRYLAGGIASINRLADPDIVFTRAQGAYLWDTGGKRYIDYHAAFGPYVLGHNDAYVNDAVRRVLDDGHSLYGSGTTELEGRLAELICGCAPFLQSVALLNTGSEATYQALRLARAWTGRDHIIVMQGGYNGWHNDVACNLMTPLGALGPRRTGEEYAFLPISAGIPQSHQALVHPVGFNDIEAVRAIVDRYPVAAIILEPILQNIGIVKPLEGYLQGLRKLADEKGFVLILDEVKTGFRHALGGYASVCGVSPDLAVYGKAIANGYPMAAIGGRKDILDLFVDADTRKRVLLAGTYNAHPVMVAAAIATIERLAAGEGAIYREFERKGSWLQGEIEALGREAGLEMFVSRQGSALCPYFMDHEPTDWHDLAGNHNFELDAAVRKSAIAQGIYTFPIAVKQWSISGAHADRDLEETAAVLKKVFASVKL
ncbi:MAG: aminotransferase class III-fold pyridoxal phosphate-dependent enzyme [Acidobacteria bacterium]|nr:aminotransferase class III-fold pyridoxal phosphate-dependent enzyme [Acidobacteriota bacterium]